MASDEMRVYEVTGNLVGSRLVWIPNLWNRHAMGLSLPRDYKPQLNIFSYRGWTSTPHEVLVVRVEATDERNAVNMARALFDESTSEVGDGE